ncbi:MAG: Eco47II family restriction endonuclease [Oscillibacter sp.]|nr:Eco47II family restriction endonuclease [Oscillibacter sp.]
MWPLSFITEEDFTKHVRDTIRQYGKSLEPIDMERFNRNIIDPVKLIFDKNVYQSTWETVIGNEIVRQRDKSNNNEIGYFHQNIFRYIRNCEVPDEGWDVVFRSPQAIDLEGKQVHTIYVEMKNKHNTMNSSSERNTFLRMKDRTQRNDDCACFLVQVIAQRSQNVKWEITVDKQKVRDKRIRRVSIDQFYALVTGEADAFYQMCMVLPSVIQDVVGQSRHAIVPRDTVIASLERRAGTKDLEADNAAVAEALYRLAFGDYLGFHNTPLFRY